MKTAHILVWVTILLAALLSLGRHTESTKEYFWGVGPLVDNIILAGFKNNDPAITSKLENLGKQADDATLAGKMKEFEDATKQIKKILKESSGQKDDVQKLINNFEATAKNYNPTIARENLEEFGNSTTGFGGDSVKGSGKKFSKMTDEEFNHQLAFAASGERLFDYDMYHTIKAYAIYKGKQVDTYIYQDGKMIKCKLPNDDLVKSFEKAVSSREELAKLGIKRAHHFEDVARALKLGKADIAKGLKVLPLERSLIDIIKGDATLSSAQRLLKKRTPPKEWYSNWKSVVTIGGVILMGIVIPLAMWLWPKSPLDKGTLSGSSTTAQECTGLCQFLNDPNTAPIAGGISWMSLCCCCCCCCSLVLMIIGGSGGGGESNNFL